MWRIPNDTPQITVPNSHDKLREVTTTTPLDDVFQYWDADGAILIRGLLNDAEIGQLNGELATTLDNVQRGSLINRPAMLAFRGRKPIRAGDIINHSAIFRNCVLESDFIHAICERYYRGSGSVGDYWLSAATTLNAGAPQDAQMLHRDSPPYAVLGLEGTESQISFLFATTDFTEANGAMRVIPRSHKWPFDRRGNMEQTVPAEMKAGDGLLMSGKVVHGMGENKTGEDKGCIQLSVCASSSTPAEAHPFIVKPEIAKLLSRRAQRFLGFRLQ